MKAEIITIGDEILIGQIVDSNAVWIAEQLHGAGIDIVRMETVPDEPEVISDCLTRALQSVDLVVVTGGLGPTHDDVTREAIAHALNTDLHVRESALRRIARRYEEQGRPVPDSAAVQATVPDGFDVLSNAVGSAPGFWKAWTEDDRTRMLAVLPGVPAEMQAMMKDEVLPRVRQHRDLFEVRSRVLLTVGIGESTLQDKIRDIVPGPGARTRLAYLPNPGGVRLRLTAMGDDPAQIEEDLDRFEARLRTRLGLAIYGTGDDTLEAAMGRLLREHHLTIAAAESCTGGLVANRISDVSGSSAYLLGGVVAYCNSVKVEMLGVEEMELANEGAVSEAVAIQMARGARDRLKAAIGVSTTGIAGPTGGTPEKPVGTVWIGYVGPDGEEARLLQLVKHRGLNKELTATALLDLVRRRVMKMTS